jgi:hypothetical protein
MLRVTLSSSVKIKLTRILAMAALHDHILYTPYFRNATLAIGSGGKN